MNSLQPQLIELARAHFQNEVLCQFQQRCPDILDGLVIFVTGSTSFGFCDDRSDVDIAILSKNNPNSEQAQVLMEVGRRDYKFGSKRISYGYGMGMRLLERYLQNKETDFWASFNDPYSLYALQKAVVILDPSDALTHLKKSLQFYPPELFTKVVRGLWITVCDSGTYNAEQSLVRQQFIEVNIFLNRAIEALMRLVYLLNHEYYPPSKWLSIGMRNVGREFQTFGVLELQNIPNSLQERHGLFLECVGGVSRHLAEKEILERECVENYGLNFSKPWFVFNTF